MNPLTEVPQSQQPSYFANAAMEDVKSHMDSQSGRGSHEERSEVVYTNGHTNGHSTGHIQEYSNGHMTPSGGITQTSLPNGTNTTPVDIPVAVCGMAMRLPGGIRNDKQLYDFLHSKRDAISIVPSDRYNVDAYYSEHGRPGTISTRHGYFINDLDFTNFDLSMFTVTPAEADQVDPNHRLVLELVREAFESAGETQWRGKPIGTYVGMFSEDWQELQHKDTQEYNPYRVLGGLDFALPNRVAYEYDLKGPSMIIKTACSSAGLGLHEALQAIQRGDISAALVCGSNLILAPGMTIQMSLQMTLSPEGSSKSFDASADGYARGEAVNVLYIKRLDDAIRDGNPIRAVIRGSASNADGKTNGLANPNPDAHEAVIRKAYQSAGLDISQTTVCEAHATGTKIGDPLEVKAIARCFSERGVFLGAIKPNLGHSEGASAISSVMKAVLSLENQTILPNIKFHTPNPAIPWDQTKLVVPVEPTAWPSNRRQRISVSSYGIGGSNAHFVIDSAASFGIQTAKKNGHQAPSPRWQLLFFSANHAESLKRVAQSMQDYLTIHPDRLEDMAYTLCERREHLKLRSFGVFDETGVAAGLSAPAKFQSPRKVAFVFTGQGAQWVHMGRDLMIDHPSFLEDIRRMDEVLQSLEHRPSWSIEDTLMNMDDKTVMAKAEFSQPICTALQVALVNLLATWGVTASAVIGHSSGEIAASYAAGALSSSEAIIAAFYRGYVCRTAHQAGGMAAVGIGKAEVAPFLEPNVRVACENSASSVTLSGDLDVLESVMHKIRSALPDVLCRKLVVEMAYHSHHMLLVGDTYRELIAKHLTPAAPKVPFYSSVKAKCLKEAGDFGPQYWQNNLERPVLFRSAASLLLKESKDCSVHLEVGPHSALKGPLRQTYSEQAASINYASSLTRDRSDTVAFLESIGNLWSFGVNISYPQTGSGASVLTDLPTYPWHYERSCWAETRIMKNWRFRRHLPHDILGLRTLESSDAQPSWRKDLRLVDVPFLKDHCVGNDIVFPGAGYIAMAGEACYQMTGTREFTVRHVELSKALVLYAERSTELVTCLQPQRLTSTLDSEWYEFSIVSSDGTAWNKHCSGLVRSGRASPLPVKRDSVLARPVSSPRWYTTMSRVGLNYGSRFQGLENIRASVLDKVAEADVVDQQDVSESLYMIHPSTLDLVFQSLTVATTRGIYRDFKTLFLPTFIEELYIGDVTRKAFRVTTTSGGKPGTVRGSSYGTCGDDMIFYLRGFQGTAMRDSEPPVSSELKTLQLQWKPHFDFLQAGDLMKMQYDIKDQIQDLERLYVICALEARDKLFGRSTKMPHMEMYRTWLDDQFSLWEKPEYPLVEDPAQLISMSSEERQAIMPTLFDRCVSSGGWAPATAIWRAFDKIVPVFEGQEDYLDILLQDGVLTGIYSWYNDIWDFTNYMQLLGNTQPQMRILEIGAGTGGLTAKFLEQLRSDYGERLYLKYTFTDISSGFFVQAKERFKDHDGLEFKALDISRDPVEQGFTPGEYDLIIASNVLHATPWLQDTLTSVRTLLQPKGRLFLQELCPTTRAMSFIMGQFSGWWLSADDGRVGSPFISPTEWDKRLRAAGFAGCESVTLDNQQPYTYNANIVARPALPEHGETQRITLLHGAEQHPLVEVVASQLRHERFEVDLCQWGQEIPAEQDVISFLDLGKVLLRDVGEEDLHRLIQLVDILQQSTMLWLTPPAQIGCSEPHAAQMLGLARTIRSELAMTFATLELEHQGSGAAEAVVATMRKIRSCKDDNGELDPDTEYVWSGGALHIGRFHWIPVAKSLADTAGEAEMLGLDIATPGLLSSLHYRSQPLGRPDSESINIRMAAVGLNFKDVMIAMGIINGSDTLNKDTSPFGLEGAGYVTEVGANAPFAVGDRVMTIGCESVGMATIIQRPASLCVRIPDGLSDEEAATMPVVYVTVLMFLVEKWQLSRGQSILIHSAAGGVGICAMYVAKWIGAEIYATVGSEDKAEFLQREFGLQRERIFHSRDSSFYDAAMKATNGNGMDLVLNSLSGELLHDSWKCVAPHGAMIEIGKRDMVGRGKLALDPFEDNRTFMGGDVARLLVTHKPIVARLLQLTVEQFKQGNFKPITPITTFEAGDVQEAFRFMQKGSHMGKIVVRFAPDTILPQKPSVPAPSFRSDRSYVLVGGLGGLGKAIAAWMVQYGATSLIFLSRSAGKSSEDRAFIHELALQGCKAQCHACDISDAEAVKVALASPPAPIAGAMQMAMVLADVGVMGMDIESWHKATRPKIQGTWNLHDLLPQDMDFFVLFSSVGGTFGYYGQSNYASANTFLDAFVQHRQALGLAASVLNIGPVDDVGYVSRTATTRETLLATLETLLTEQDFLDGLQLAIARSQGKYAPSKKNAHPDSSTIFKGYQNLGQVVQALESKTPIMDPSNGNMWKRDPRMSIYRNIQKTNAASETRATDRLKQFLASAMSDPRSLDEDSSVELIGNELGKCVSSFLMRDDDEPDLTATLQALGVDSLVAIEVRNWWKSNLGIDVSVLELMNGGSIKQLGELAAKRLKEKFSSR